MRREVPHTHARHASTPSSPARPPARAASIRARPHTQTCTHPRTHSRTHLPTHSLTHSLTHPPTHPLTHSCAHVALMRHLRVPQRLVSPASAFCMTAAPQSRGTRVPTRDAERTLHRSFKSFGYSACGLSKKQTPRATAVLCALIEWACGFVIDFLLKGARKKKAPEAQGGGRDKGETREGRAGPCFCATAFGRVLVMSLAFLIGAHSLFNMSAGLSCTLPQRTASGHSWHH